MAGETPLPARFYACSAQSREVVLTHQDHKKVGRSSDLSKGGPRAQVELKCVQDSWVPLSREESKLVAHRGSMVIPLEDQRLDDALAGEKDRLGQDLAEIRIAAARDTAGVLHLDLIGETPDDREEMRVYDRRAVVRDPVHVLLPVAANAVGLDQRDIHLPGHVQELETHVPPGKGVVVRWREPAGHQSVESADGREVRTVLRVGDIARGDHEWLGRRLGMEVDERGIVEGVLEEIGEIVHFILVEAQAARGAGSAGVREALRERPRE